MSTVIYKYKLDITYKQTIKMPADAIILTAQVQNGTLCVWAIVDTEQPLDTHTFRIVGTGHVLQEDLRDTGNFAYISTVQMAAGALIWHVFLEKK